MFFLASLLGRYHALAFWFGYYIPNIISVFFHHSVRSSAYPSLPHSTLKVGTHFTLGKVSIHQEAVHHVVLCQTQSSSVVTPPEAEHHLPSSFCTRVTGSTLCYYVSISVYQDHFILNFVEKFLMHPSMNLLSSVGFHLQPCSKG